jgi:hypothetical protein
MKKIVSLSFEEKSICLRIYFCKVCFRFENINPILISIETSKLRRYSLAENKQMAVAHIKLIS